MPHKRLYATFMGKEAIMYSTDSQGAPAHSKPLDQGEDSDQAVSVIENTKNDGAAKSVDNSTGNAQLSSTIIKGAGAGAGAGSGTGTGEVASEGAVAVEGESEDPTVTSTKEAQSTDLSIETSTDDLGTNESTQHWVNRSGSRETGAYHVTDSAEQDDHDQESESKAGMARTVAAISSALESTNRAELWDLVHNMHEADLADVLEALPSQRRVQLVSTLGAAFDFRSLAEVEDRVREQLVAKLPASAVWRAAQVVAPEDAAELITDLGESEQEAIFAQLSPAQAGRVRRVLECEPDTAGRVMEPNVVAVPPNWNVGQVRAYMQDRQDLPQEFADVYVVDNQRKLLGRISLSGIVSELSVVQVREIMRQCPQVFRVNTPTEEVANLFDKYNLISAPVLDDSGKLCGSIGAEVGFELLQEQLEDDIRNLTGVRHASLFEPAWTGAQRRSIWLLINLVTAGIAASVVGIFTEQIAALVALAVLLPVVPSVGGNAGMQTLTLMVRAIADGTVRSFTVIKLITREISICLLIGLMVGAVAALPVLYWFESDTMALVVGIALLANVLVSGIAGIVIPLTLHKMKFDPAVASPIFVSLATDVAGLLIFLALGTFMLL